MSLSQAGIFHDVVKAQPAQQQMAFVSPPAERKGSIADQHRQPGNSLHMLYVRRTAVCSSAVSGDESENNAAQHQCDS